MGGVVVGEAAMRPMWGVEPERGSVDVQTIAIVALSALSITAWLLFRVEAKRALDLREENLRLTQQLANAQRCEPVAGVIVIPTSAPDSSWVADGPTGARFPLKNLREASLALVLRRQ